MPSPTAELIERVKAATGPDEELDLRIFAEFDGRDFRIVTHPKFGLQMLGRNRKPPHDECWLNHHSFSMARQRYTASLDAAIALVERVLPRWDRTVSKAIFRHNGIERVVHSASVNSQGPNDVVFSAEGASEPLALLLALLSSLQNMEGNGDG